MLARRNRLAAIAAIAAVGLALAAPAAAGTLNTSLCAYITAAYSATAGGLGAPTFVIDRNLQQCVVMPTGFGTGQADLLYAGTRNLAASGNETLDLFGGLTDPFGATLNFAKVKAVLVKAHSDNTNSVVVGNAGSNPFLGPLAGTTPTVTVPPGGVYLVTAPAGGWAVTNSSTDNLKVANSSSGTAINYDLIVIGTSQ